jgi:1,4-alpha-glucan branching enzyme
MKKTIVKKAYHAAAHAGKSSSEKPKTAAKAKGLKKQHIPSCNLCKVTFRLPKDVAHDAKMAAVVGDFNNWNPTEHKMKKLKSGDFTLTLELPCNREFSFRYLVDTGRWENDWFADKYIPNDFGSEDSVVIT